MRHSWLLRLMGKTVHDLLEDPALQIKFHKWGLVVWTTQMVFVALAFYLFPTWWAAFSVLYLIEISLGSNWETEFDALSAAQASLHGLEALQASAALAQRLAAVEAEVEPEMTHLLVQVAEWAISVLGFTSSWLLGRRHIAGWWYSLAAQILWLYVATATSQWAFVPGSFVYSALALNGWRHWRRDNRGRHET
jgi:hypothetical protein